MIYRQVQAPPDLAPWVECAWTLRGPLSNVGRIIVPDGRLELIFHFGDRPAQDGGPQPAALIAGRMAKALELRGTGRMDALGIRLRPEAAGAVLPCRLLGVTEDMDCVLGSGARHAREQLGSVPRDLWPVMRSLLGGRTGPDAAVAHSIRLIEAAHGIGTVDSFLPPGLGLRQWQRRFSAATGFSPKVFARITRVQHLVSRCSTEPKRSWADVALDAGFYDQSHLVNEFRLFTGQSPQAYFRSPRDAFFQDNGG